MYLKRDEILAAKDLPYEDVDVPEWGGVVRMQGLTVAGKRELERIAIEDGKNAFLDLKTEIVALCAVDENGKQLFVVDDIQALNEKSAVVVERLFRSAMKLNALVKKDAEKN